MTYQTHVPPVGTIYAPAFRAVRKLFKWLNRPADLETSAPMSDRLRRDAGLPNAYDANAEHKAAQTYRDRYMNLL